MISNITIQESNLEKLLHNFFLIILPFAKSGEEGRDTH